MEEQVSGGAKASNATLPLPPSRGTVRFIGGANLTWQKLIATFASGYLQMGLRAPVSGIE